MAKYCWRCADCRTRSLEARLTSLVARIGEAFFKLWDDDDEDEEEDDDGEPLSERALASVAPAQCFSSLSLLLCFLRWKLGRVFWILEHTSHNR